MHKVLVILTLAMAAPASAADSTNLPPLSAGTVGYRPPVAGSLRDASGQPRDLDWVRRNGIWTQQASQADNAQNAAQLGGYDLSWVRSNGLYSSNAGNANYASNAGNANYASNAGRASNADYADNAAHATNSDQWRGADPPTCGTNQALRWNGSSFVCVTAGSNNNAVLPPTCGSGQVLTYSGGSYQCVAVVSRMTLPTCSTGQVLTWTGSSFSCTNRIARADTIPVLGSSYGNGSGLDSRSGECTRPEYTETYDEGHFLGAGVGWRFYSCP